MEIELGRIVDALPGFLWTAFPDGQMDFLSQRWFDVTGLGVDKCRDRGWQTAVHPEDLPRLLAGWRTDSVSGATVETQARLRGSNGKYRWFLFRAHASADASGRIVKWCGLSIDLDERKQAEEALREDHKRAEALMGGEKRLFEMIARDRPMADILDALCRFVENTATGSYCSIMLLDRSGTKFQEAIAPSIASEFNASARGWPLNRIRGPSVMAARDNIQVIMSDVASDTRWRSGWRALAQKHGLQSCWSTPIVSQVGKVLGTFALYWGEPASPNPLQLELIEQFTHIASIAIERAQRDAALRLSEARLAEAERELQLTIDTFPAILARYRRDGSPDFVNQTGRTYAGLSTDSLRGQRWVASVHPDDFPRLEAAWRAHLRTGQPFEMEQRVRRADGEYRWFFIRRVPLRGENGEVIRWYGAAHDIEDRKRAEERAFEAERNLKLTVDSIPALAWSARPDGSAEFFNQQYLDYLGVPWEQALDWGWAAAVHPDDLSGLTATWQSLLASGRSGEAEARLRRHDGEYRWFLFRATPLRDDNGNIVKWYGFNTDIEDRKRAEEKLRRSEAFLAKAQGLSLTGSFSFHSATKEFTWSEELYRIFEFEPGIRVPLKLLASRFHPEDRHVVEEVAARLRGGAPDFDYEHRLLMPDGSIKHIHVIGHGTPDKEGNGREYLGAVQDITQRRVAEAALDKARSELAHVTRMVSLGALTVSIAHEVNQPLAGIVTNASTCLRMLASDPPNVEGACETARRTIRDGNRAADVITRLRALFSKKAAVTETVDLNEATRQVLALVSSDLLRNRIFLRTELDDDHPLLVIGDRVQLQQAILNLARNAVDAMNDVNDRPRHLLVRAERAEEGEARLIVRDSGVGLDPQSPERLFDAFYTTKSDGMGIGLFVSRSIIESHNGRLWAEANDGPGATFSFSIPCLADRATGDRASDTVRRPRSRAHATR